MLAYLGVAAGLYVWRGASFTPDRWFVLLFVGALLFGQWKAFLRDWIPFVFLIFGYEILRGVADNIVDASDVRTAAPVRDRYPDVALEELIAADKALFGGEVPALWLQDKLFVLGQVRWYDTLAVLLYALHFVFPLLFAFVLWIRWKERFRRFSLAFLLMTYAAFAFFLLYPAAPPWLAHRWGLLDGLQYPSDQAIQTVLPERYDNLDTFKIWDEKSPNPVAAMPSLHAAFPWLVLLFAVKYFGRKGLVVVVYNVALWFSVVYLGQHWVVDILAGMAWATVCFVLVHLPWRRWWTVRRAAPAALDPLDPADAPA